MVVGPTPLFVWWATSLTLGQPVEVMEPAAEEMAPAAEEMGRLPLALEPVVEVLGRPVLALEPTVEAIQPCLPLQRHRPQQCDQLVNG